MKKLSFIVRPLLVGFLLSYSSCVVDLTNNVYCKHDPEIIVIDDCVAAIANAFTPSADGINDVFGLQCNCTVDDYSLIIESNTGRNLFKANDPFSFWDGTFEDKKIEGIVTYEIAFTMNGQTVNRKGSVSVMRFDYREGIVVQHCENCAFPSDFDWNSGAYTSSGNFENILCP